MSGRILLSLLFGAVCIDVAETRNPAGATSTSTNPTPPCKTISPSPQGYTCGIRGYYRGVASNILTQTNVPNLDACVNLVGLDRIGLNQAGGSNVHFNEVSKECTLMKYNFNTHRSKVESNPKSNSVFYDSGCFRCPRLKCPLPLGANLIRDPGFEQNSKYYYPWFTGFSSDAPSHASITSPGLNSSNALHLQPTHGSNALEQEINEACRNEVYYLSFNYKIPDNVSDNHALFSVGFDAGPSIKVQQKPTNGTWVKFEDIAISLDGLVGFSLTTEGSIPPNYRTTDLFIDNGNVSSLGPSLDTVPGAKSHVLNGGFERGNLSPWVFRDEKVSRRTSKYNFHSIVSPGLNGTGKAFEFSNSANSSNIEQKFTLTQFVSLVKGTKYLFSIDLKGDLDVILVTIGPRKDILFPTYPPTTSQTHHLVFIAQGDSANLTIEVEYSSDGPGRLLLDNISILNLR